MPSPEVKYYPTSTPRPLKKNVKRVLVASEMDLREKLKQLNDPEVKEKLSFIIDKLEAANKKLIEANAAGAQSNIRPLFGLPIGEIWSLIKDLYQGKLQKYLNDILHDAKASINLIPNDNAQSEHKKQFELKITIATEVIDKYSKLFEKITGNKAHKADDENQDLLQQAKKTVANNKDDLNAIKLMYECTRLRTLVKNMQDNQKTKCCAFFCRSRQKKSAYQPLSQAMTDLCMKGFSPTEVLGGLVFLKRKMTDAIIDKKDKRTLDKAMNQLFINNAMFMAPSENDLYERFRQRIISLNINWEKPFVVPGQENDHSHLMPAGYDVI